MPSDILDTPLLQLTPTDPVAWRDLVANVCVLGQTGSGKTTGSGAHLAKAILKSGAGVLVLCAKSDERALWERYCTATGRSGSLIVLDGKTHRYNFIAAELARHGLAGINIVIETLMQIVDTVRSSGGARHFGPILSDCCCVGRACGLHNGLARRDGGGYLRFHRR